MVALTADAKKRLRLFSEDMETGFESAFSSVDSSAAAGASAAAASSSSDAIRAGGVDADADLQCAIEASLA